MGNSDVVVSHLQYADDTLLIGEAYDENLWVMKCILRCFEIVSGLKVNFFKSSLVGVNVSELFLGSRADFLNCKVGKIPFRYLGSLVGANPRKASTWQPMIDSIVGRLGSWKIKFLSRGGGGGVGLCC